MPHCRRAVGMWETRSVYSGATMSNLEVHHSEFRSRSGPDSEPWGDAAAMRTSRSRPNEASPKQPRPSQLRVISITFLRCAECQNRSMIQEQERDRKISTIVQKQEQNGAISPSVQNHTALLMRVVLISVSTIALFYSLGEQLLRTWDESIYAEVAKEMLTRHSWLTLSWNFEPWVDKPPLFMWLTALLYQLFRSFGDVVAHGGSPMRSGNDLAHLRNRPAVDGRLGRIRRGTHPAYERLLHLRKQI